MSSTSTNGSGTSAPGSATSPSSSGSRKKLSLKFWLNQLHRTMVQSAPESCSTRSARWASSSPRPDSSTSRRVPAATASSDSSAIASGAPGTARSGK